MINNNYINLFNLHSQPDMMSTIISLVDRCENWGTED